MITAAELRVAERRARLLNDFLDRCNAENCFPDGILMGFDLDFLADSFELAADRMEEK
jgi:hypothetical protein